MIPAIEALRLPNAQLTVEEIAAADALEAFIEDHVRKNMARRGCELAVKETNANIIAEVNQRLKAAGYLPQWQALVERNKFNAATQQHVGFQLALGPTDESYRTASQPILQ